MSELLNKAIRALMDENNRLSGEVSDLRSRNDYLNALVRETHHRTKNYLSVLMSALNMQGRSCAGTEAEVAIREARSMIMTVLTLNEMFSMSETLESISVRHYISKLARRVFEVYGGSKMGVSLRLHIDDVSVHSDLLLPCGMIINELIMNSLKHAFSRKEGGSVKVSFLSVGGRKVRLSVKDDGCGVISSRDDSLGLKMIRVLCKQIGGTFEVSHKDGSECSVMFET